MNILFCVRNRSIDHILWGYVEAHVYTDNPVSNPALEDNIEAFIRVIPAKMLERVCQNWTKRMDYLRRRRGKQLQALIYMPRTIDLNKDFINFSEFYVFFFWENFPIALKKSPILSFLISFLGP